MLTLTARLITQTHSKWYLQVGQKKLWISKSIPEKCNFNYVESELQLTPYFKNLYEL